MQNKIVRKAIEMYEQDVGDMGCIKDASCECFGCLLADFALDEDRREESAIGQFENEMTCVRESLAIIPSGEIEREHCVGGPEAYVAIRGKRKLMLKDAKSIAASCVARINRSMAEFWEARHGK